MKIGVSPTTNRSGSPSWFAGSSVSLSLLDWSITADPVEAPEGFPNGDAFHTILDNIIISMAPEIEGPLQSIPLPQFIGFRLADLQARTDGPGGGYLTLTCDLELE